MIGDERGIQNGLGNQNAERINTTTEGKKKMKRSETIEADHPLKEHHRN